MIRPLAWLLLVACPCFAGDGDLAGKPPPRSAPGVGQPSVSVHAGLAEDSGSGTVIVRVSISHSPGIPKILGKDIQMIESGSYLEDAKRSSRESPALVHWPKEYEMGGAATPLLLVFSANHLRARFGTLEGLRLRLNGLPGMGEAVIEFSSPIGK